MSVYIIRCEGGKKMMYPVRDEKTYRLLRDSASNQRADKHHMVQMNYSCLPNPDGTLRGSTRMSTSVAMDIDLDPTQPDYQQQMERAKQLVMAKKEEIGLLMLELSAGKGYHLAFRRRPELSQEENLRWVSSVLGVAFDKGAKDITRVFFTPPCAKLLYLDKALFEIKECPRQAGVAGPAGSTSGTPAAQAQAAPSAQAQAAPPAQAQAAPAAQAQAAPAATNRPLEYESLPYSEIIKMWWVLYNEGHEPMRSNRNALTYELAVNLRNICGYDRTLLDQIIPCYDGFPESEKLSCIDSALSAARTQMPLRLKRVLQTLHEKRAQKALAQAEEEESNEAEAEEGMMVLPGKVLPKMPQGIKDSIEAVGAAMAMPVIFAICPAIGMLATGVKVEVHGKMNSLNLITYIAGDFASGKGSIDPVVEAWIGAVKRQDRMFQMQEDEWRMRKRAAKNKKQQPDEPKLPVRCLTLNNTVANLAERLANTQGKHAFSFTPEADTVAQKWRSAMSDFSVMLRQSYDGSTYEREARSAEAVTVHIERLLWNVVMCGTPDALYRVVSNYTDGLQSRIAVARTPDNTFAPLSDCLHVLTERQRIRIGQIAHLLPLMEGEVSLNKLEQKGREWLERVRLETMENDDRVCARQRLRTCPTTMRMMTCLMLCRVAELLIAKHGLLGAETLLRQQPDLWQKMIVKTQTPQMLAAFDVLADYQVEQALYFFRDRIQAAFDSRNYAGSANSQRSKRGKNDTIFSRLGSTFTFDQAWQQCVAQKGPSVTRESVRQMMKNWRAQGLVSQQKDGPYQKICGLK